MNDLLQQLVGMGPGIGAAVSGNGNAFQSFMDGWTRAQMRDQQQKRLTQQDAIAAEDRANQMSRQQAQDARVTEDQEFQRNARNMSVAGTLGQAASGAESVPEGEAAIDTLFRVLSPQAQQTMAPARDAALSGVQRTVTGRQKKQVEAFVDAALKTSHVADNPDADPELINLPEHIQRIIGKPAARLSELQQFAQLPVGKPSKPQRAPSNPTEASLAYEAAGGDAGKAFQMLNAPKPSQADPEISALRKELLQAQVDKAKDGAARASGAGQPSPYSVERASRTIASVDQLMAKVNRWTTGIGSMLSGIPETDARNFRAELDTLKANIAFNELTAMREASKTGGALGAVSDKEMNLLQSALGALDAGQSPENIRQQLQQIKDSVQRWQDAQGIKPAVSHAPTNAPKKNPFRP